VAHFVVQLHDATTLHYDFRLELGGVMRSWAVPKGPSLDPGVKRLAVAVPDHAVEPVAFEGVYADSIRGSGAVILWDEGEFELVRAEPDHLVVTLHGHKLAGGFALTRTDERQWILVKMADDEARRGSDIAAERPESVRSGKTWQQLATG
jgi:DNA ligase D-like protein (predicted 3'-phosphoesterase)